MIDLSGKCAQVVGRRLMPLYLESEPCVTLDNFVCYHKTDLHNIIWLVPLWENVNLALIVGARLFCHWNENDLCFCQVSSCLLENKWVWQRYETGEIMYSPAAFTNY